MQALRGHWQLIALVSLVFVLWPTPVIIPLKILIVFLHELSHAGMTVLTGGDVISLTVSADQGGAVFSRGGSRFLILSAGYLGSLLLGVILLISATRTNADRAVMGLFGALMLIVTALYVREGFAVLFCVGAGILMLVTARFLPHDVNDLALRVIGLTSMIYVPLDIFSDTIARSNLRSDARMLADEFGGATVLWGGIWLLISLAVILFSLWRGLGTSSNLSFKKQA
ncbi:MAG: hypothetical protein ACI85V_000102 [bacterium]|jgi:hypothetical protein